MTKYPFTWSSFKNRFWQALRYLRSPKGIASLIITLVGSIVGSILTVLIKSGWLF